MGLSKKQDILSGTLPRFIQHFITISYWFFTNVVKQMDVFQFDEMYKLNKCLITKKTSQMKIRTL